MSNQLSITVGYWMLSFKYTSLVYIMSILLLPVLYVVFF